MFHKLYSRITSVDLTLGVFAYIAIIITYVMVPQDISTVRYALSRIALALLVTISIVLLDRIRREL